MTSPRPFAEVVEELRRLCEAATPGPWFWNSYSAIYAEGPPRPPDDEPNGYRVCDVEIYKGDLSTPEGGNNARLIEAMRNALPALLSRLASRDTVFVAAVAYINCLDRERDDSLIEREVNLRAAIAAARALDAATPQGEEE